MIKNILKGFIIGIAKIIPGVSGSMLAISLGVYEKLLNIIAHIRHITYIKFKFLFSLFLGAIIGISLFSNGVKWLLNNCYFSIMLLFIGLIIGGFPDLWNVLKSSKMKIKNIIIFILSFTFSYILTFLGSIQNISNDNIFIYFSLGLIEAFSSIVPGISGTAIYMSLGVYDMLLDFFGNIVNPEYMKFGIFFGSGILVGVLLIAKVITFLLNKYKISTYFAISGFMMSSIIIMIKEAMIYIFNRQFTFFSLLEILFGIFLIYVGFKVTIKINNLLSSP